VGHAVINNQATTITTQVFNQGSCRFSYNIPKNFGDGTSTHDRALFFDRLGQVQRRPAELGYRQNMNTHGVQGPHLGRALASYTAWKPREGGACSNIYVDNPVPSWDDLAVVAEDGVVRIPPTRTSAAVRRRGYSLYGGRRRRTMFADRCFRIPDARPGW